MTINEQGCSVVTLGTFDGVHLGHRSIIQEVVLRSKILKCESILVTFDPHPRFVVGDRSIKLLTTLEERLEIIKSMGIEKIVVLHFTHDFALLSADDFYRKYIVSKLKVKEIIVGYNHAFGKNREAGLKELENLGTAYGFKAVQIPAISVNGQHISSSLIRRFLEEGNIEKANDFLGHQYSMSGNVVKGDGLGVQLGFPTANIMPSSEDKVVPGSGVYFVQIEIENKIYYGMMNIGCRPTVTDSGKQTIEVNIFDLDQMIYGKYLTINFIKKLRAENKYLSKEELINQLKNDRNECMKYLKEGDSKCL